MAITALYAAAQQQTQRPIIITGKLWATTDDTITLVQYAHKLGTTQTGGIMSTCKTNNGYFRFELNSADQALYCSIRSAKTKNLLLDDLLMQAGDSIHICAVAEKPTDRTKPLVNITGKNAAKNQLQHQWAYARYYRKIVGFNPLLSFTTNSLAEALPLITSDFTALKHYWDSIAHLLPDTISAFANTVFLTDLEVSMQTALLGKFNNLFEASCKQQVPKDSMNKLLTAYQEIIQPKMQQLLSRPMPGYFSPDFLNLAVRKIMTDARIKKGSLGRIPAEDYLEWLGAWPDFCKEEVATALAAYILTYGLKAENMSEVLYSLAQQVNKKKLKDIIIQFQDTYTKGSPVYPFVLTNAQGGKTDIRLFKDKTVVVDFWFTGCSACITMAKLMKQLKKAIGPRNDIVFMSISIDKNQQTWLRSVAAEIYTEKDNINLYTEGLENNHPLIRYYHFSGYPRLMVIGKNNKLVSVNPPLPDNWSDLEKLRSFIVQAAAE